MFAHHCLLAEKRVTTPSHLSRKNFYISSIRWHAFISYMWVCYYMAKPLNPGWTYETRCIWNTNITYVPKCNTNISDKPEFTIHPITAPHHCIHRNMGMPYDEVELSHYSFSQWCPPLSITSSAANSTSFCTKPWTSLLSSVWSRCWRRCGVVSLSLGRRLTVCSPAT
jgi:hypothetical protein